MTVTKKSEMLKFAKESNLDIFALGKNRNIFIETLTEFVSLIEKNLLADHEPVAWWNPENDTVSTNPLYRYNIDRVPLYSNPTLVVSQDPLSEYTITDMYCEPRTDKDMIKFARCIEKAHGIGVKND